MSPKKQPRDAGARDTRRYYIHTWGCQMNVHDSEKLAGALEGEGYSPASVPEDADVVLLNTCSVREKAAEKSFTELGRLRRIKKQRPGLVIGYCGCVAQQEGQAVLRRAPHVDFVVGPRASGAVPELVKRLSRGDGSARHAVDIAYRNDSIEFPFERIRRQGGNRSKAFVTVIEGCNHRCTFCIVPRTRGREASRDMDGIVREVRSLAARGVLEVEFLGQTVNAYRDAEGRTLADLLRATARVPGIARIRFTTSHPAQMTEKLMDAMAEYGSTVCPYLHLPAQSGSSRVLRSMRRGYDRARYLDGIRALRARIPDISFGTDIIVGFPGETEEDFRATLSLLDEVGFDTVFSFCFSPRPGTPAAALPHTVASGEKLDRLARLQERQKRLQEDRNRRWVGRTVEVLVEGPSKRAMEEWTGRTSHNRIVNFGGPGVPGRMQRVRIVGASAFSLRGEPVSGAELDPRPARIYK